MLKKITILLLMIVMALVSFAKVAPLATNPENHKYDIEQIDDKIETALVLVASSTATSAALSFLKDDWCTPIANELAELTKWFGLVLAALYLEKYLLTLTGYLAFSVLIPIASILFGIGWAFKKEQARGIAYKILFIAVASYLLVPTSVKVSDLIYSTYETSIDETLTAATTVENSGAMLDEEGSFVTKIADAATSLFEKAKSLVTKFIEALAVMLVTTCIIPILILAIFVSMCKLLIGYPISDGRIVKIVQENAKKIGIESESKG